MNKNLDYYTEKFRPQFHFSPELNWMNDPNGMVYYEGEFHLFYQHYPYGTNHGPMHWGHAVSQNMVHWEHLPIALKPDENGVIFSGSAVVDWYDTSGFFDGGSGLVAIFTHNEKYANGTRREQQSIAYSTDKGRTWTKYEGNPVLIDKSLANFRDPKVFWDTRFNRWVMVIAVGDRIHFYLSSDLKSWEFASEFGMDEGSHLGVWECPDLFELPVSGDDSYKKYVLIVSIGPDENHPEGSRTQYFIGSFDGTHFINENLPETVLWLDYGRDNYAGVSWSDIPEEDGRRIYVGWMSNWKYASSTPTIAWRSAMTIPRELSIKSTSDGARLYQTPIAELMQLRQVDYSPDSTTIVLADSIVPTEIKGNSLEIVAEFELETAKEFGFKVMKSKEEETVIGYDTENQRLFVDRTHSGVTDFFEYFSGKHEGPLQVINNKIKMHIFVDWSSIEVFGNDGEITITEQIFPEHSSNGLELYASEGSVKLLSLEIYSLKSVWREESESNE